MSYHQLYHHLIEAQAVPASIIAAARLRYAFLWLEEDIISRLSIDTINRSNEKLRVSLFNVNLAVRFR